ncbi:hypothetical protein_gp170 [Bacillus phage vB_BceM_WH1]|nr:hypothetical protein_gp170 [Bacillus phage vB_BceM_WH1]
MNPEYMPNKDPGKVKRKTIGEPFLVEILGPTPKGYAFKAGDKIVVMEYNRTYNMDDGDLFVVPCDHNDAAIRKHGGQPNRHYAYDIAGMYVHKRRYKKYVPINIATISGFKEDKFYE